MNELIDLLRSVSNLCVSLSNIVTDESVAEKAWDTHLDIEEAITKFSKVSA